MVHMTRRQLITLLGGVATAWPLAARAQQQAGRMRHVGVLMGWAEDTESRSWVAAFLQALQRLGWAEGNSAHIEIRWGGSDRQRVAAQAKELVQLQPDVILVGPTYALLSLQQETRSIPIVFVNVSDPLGQGIVERIARPTGNVTGFSSFEFSLIGKWLQILKEAAPSVNRVGLMISTINAVSPRWFQLFESVAPGFGMKPVAFPIQNRTEDIDSTVKSLASEENSALIVPGDTFVLAPPIRRRIIELVAAHRLPTLYSRREFAADGGLMSYGIDLSDTYRRAASYVDRILKGETPADLPVQQPTKFHFIINLKTSRTLGLQLAPTLLAIADEVIE
jgi:putative ABC transport system substrate-binding protein